VGTRRIVVTLAILFALGGCSISHNIIDIKPPPQPPLQDLEKHLDYVDPDQGRPTYVAPNP
jgi:hypothetical protein